MDSKIKGKRRKGYDLLDTFDVLDTVARASEIREIPYEVMLPLVLRKLDAQFTRTGCIVVLTGERGIDDVTLELLAENNAKREARNAKKH